MLVSCWYGPDGTPIYTNMLSDASLRRLKPRISPYKLSDGGGLYILVTPTGSRLWRLAYRYSGKQKTLAFGAYPAVSLADARERRDHAKQMLSRGTDPSKAQVAKSSPDKEVFEQVGRRWFAAQKARWKPSYSTRIEARLERDVYPDIGHLPLSAIDRHRVLTTLRKVEERGSIHIAKRLKNHCSEIFRFAMAEGTTASDPTAGIEKALQRTAPVQHRARLKAAELPQFMRDLADLRCEPVTRLALRLIMLTFVRTSELRFARWQEFDLSAKLWRIPSERMKTGHEHYVPLAEQTLAVLEEIKNLGEEEYLFPYAGASGVISENRLIYALYRMGYHTRATVHGFRGTASTMLNEEGFNRDWIERQLAHVESDAVRGAYNAAEYLAGRRKMMDWWAGYLENIQCSISLSSQYTVGEPSP